jgi:hypothetical protein
MGHLNLSHLLAGQTKTTRPCRELQGVPGVQPVIYRCSLHRLGSRKK